MNLLGRSMSGEPGEVLLSKVFSTLVFCRDCGRGGVLFAHELGRWRLPLDATTTHLRDRLFCRSCRDKGRPGKRMTVEAFPAPEGAVA